MSREFTPPEVCPVCGEAVPRGAKSCPGCGADERAGWDEDASLYDDIDLPEEAFDEDDKTARSPQKQSSGAKLWLAVAAGLLGLFILSIFLR